MNTLYNRLAHCVPSKKGVGEIIWPGQFNFEMTPKDDVLLRKMCTGQFSFKVIHPRLSPPPGVPLVE